MIIFFLNVQDLKGGAEYKNVLKTALFKALFLDQDRKHTMMLKGQMYVSVTREIKYA